MPYMFHSFEHTVNINIVFNYHLSRFATFYEREKSHAALISFILNYIQYN